MREKKIIREKKYNMRKKDNFDDIEDFDFDDKRKKSNFNKHGIDINGLDKDGYNINVIKGTREKYRNRKINWINHDDNDILHDQYGFDKDGLNKYGYKKSS